ncbi:fumarylacetoacetate hydrolase family protein [Sphingomonas sp. AR_OL41]|uniref:fumarylacetoacetate hydrolase family protein n=1 Tax=Sphingomonas sp. AR_OL41 TaxID=3042729 RepID=UPI002480A715|nr:fumarylacetoacetate hydrolase family protein [Sphingomonas sp. AR_OL41]MDH7972097.1 fumarylacetoacetate hydrolase family protein [Sphingomonas sp. AR_OL41]
MTWHALATYRRDGTNRAAIVVGEAIHDLDAVAALHAPALLGRGVDALIADWENAAPAVAALADAVRDRVGGEGCVACADLAVPFTPRRVFGAASNYIEHAEEMQTKLAAKADSEPYIFLKTVESVIGPDETVVIPPQVERPDWEVELGVVIGRAGRAIDAAQAFDHIAGYTVVNDVSARDKTRRSDFPFSHDWFRGKSFDTFTPVGPWFVPRDCLGDPHDIRLGLRVNDEAMQDGNTSEMIFDCFEQIAYLSTILELKAGDLIATGTPAGVGMGRGVFLRDGDVMTAWVDGIGELRNPVRAVAAG